MPEGEAIVAAARGVDRALVRALLRYGWDAANTPEEAQQHSQAPADSRGGSESGATAKNNVWNRHTAEPARALGHFALRIRADGRVSQAQKWVGSKRPRNLLVGLYRLQVISFFARCPCGLRWKERHACEV